MAPVHHFPNAESSLAALQILCTPHRPSLPPPHAATTDSWGASVVSPLPERHTAAIGLASFAEQLVFKVLLCLDPTSFDPEDGKDGGLTGKAKPTDCRWGHGKERVVAQRGRWTEMWPAVRHPGSDP